MPAKARAHEPGVAQSLRLPRIRLRRRTTRTVFAQTTKSRNRSVPRQSRRRNASAQENFGPPWVVEAFVPNACLFEFGARHKHRYTSSALCIGLLDLNPRPVAAATALRELIEILSAFPAL